MLIISAKVVEKYENVKDNAAFSVALVVLSSDVIACDVVMVGDFAIVWDSRVEWAGLTVANATDHFIAMISLLLTRKRSHFTVLLEMLYYFCHPLNQLIKKF